MSSSYETSFVLHCISSPLFSMRMVGSEKINSELTLIITWWLKCEGKSQCKTMLMNCDSTFDLWGAEPSRLQAPHSKMTKINLKKRNWSLAVYKYLQVMNGLQRIDQFWIDIDNNVMIEMWRKVPVQNDVNELRFYLWSLRCWTFQAAGTPFQDDKDKPEKTKLVTCCL